MSLGVPGRGGAAPLSLLARRGVAAAVTWRGALPRGRPLEFPGMEPQLSAGFCREMRESTTVSPSDSMMELS